MDSHVFRIIAEELSELVDGARLEKIYGPRPGVFSFTVFTGERKRQLLFRYERQTPLLFFSERRLDNPANPPAMVMRLRKYCGGRRLGRAVWDYAARALAFPILLPPDEKNCWLVLDMVRGASVTHDLPESFGQKPVWPEASLVDSLCARPWQKDKQTGEWQEFTVLTPLLRETLAALEPLDGRALLMDLEAGGGGLFLYADEAGRPALYSAWPLPLAICERRCIIPYPEEKQNSLTLHPWPALTVATLIDEPKFFAVLSSAAAKEDAAPLRKSSKKRLRLLAKLEQEQKRLTSMLTQREDAIVLQGLLWRYPSEAKLDSVVVDGEQGEACRRIALNPLLTLRENMARMFKESARGARGLVMLAERRAQVINQSESEEHDAWTHHSLATLSRGVIENGSEGEIKNVARFRSSDGFTLLRGKNAKGNQSLLKIGKAHDLWLHAEDGPSAHLIIRRSHAADNVPKRTLQEAAVLVGEKSWQRYDGRARIMVALLKHVHAIKGAPPGTVKVDAVLQSLVVPLLGKREDDKERGN